MSAAIASTDTDAVWKRYERFASRPPEIVFEWHDDLSEAQGWLIINSLRGGAAGGGTRMRAGIRPDDVTFLAKAMELKFAFTGPPIGGAKSGIDFDPHDPRKGEVLGRWFEAISPELLSRYGTAGDLNVNELTEVIPHCAAAGVDHPQMGVLRGHFGLEGEALRQRVELMDRGLHQPVPGTDGLGGTRLWETVTGYGVAASTRRLLELQGRDLTKTRVVLQGFGIVGGAAAHYMASAGLKIVGITDAAGGLFSEQGLTAAEVDSLLAARTGNTLPIDVHESEARELRERIWDTQAEVFVAAAASGLLNDVALDRIEKAGVDTIVSAANHPFWAARPGDTRLEREADSRFAVVADVIAGCGTAHAFACQSAVDHVLSPEEVIGSIEETVTEALSESSRRVGSTERGLLAGALEVALERCEGQPGQGQPVPA